MKWVSSGCSSHIHSYALFFHSIPAGLLWIYTIWIKLANNNSPCLFHFAGFSKLILLLRPSLILAEIVGRNFLKTIKYVLLKLSTHAHHALLIWKKNAYFSSFLCILQDKKPCGNESTFSVIRHLWNVGFSDTAKSCAYQNGFRIFNFSSNWSFQEKSLSLQNFIVFSS